MKFIFLSLFTIVMSAAACSPAGRSAPGGEALDEQVSALTEEQCEYFDVNGKVLICHATHSTRNPYVLLKVSEDAC